MLTLLMLPQVQYLEPTPPSEDLLMISTVTHVEEYKENPSRRDSVQVDLQLCKVILQLLLPQLGSQLVPSS